VSRLSDLDPLALLVHEVRSPVAALEAVSAAMSTGEGDTGARRELVRLALAACAGIERIVTDVSPASMRRETVDVGLLLREVVVAAELRGLPVAAHVAVEVPRVRADPQRLRQALDNLVANAVDHSPADGRVILDVRPEGAEIVVSVTDSGPGIPAEEQERIFEPGARLDPDRPGSGLGLAIARSIAEAHGGRLTVESWPRGGARFVLALPLADG
jgi:signal transduction histidine kinase